MAHLHRGEWARSLGHHSVHRHNSVSEDSVFRQTAPCDTLYGSTTEKYSARFFNYLIWWVRFRVRVLVVVWVMVAVDARVMVGVGLVRG